MVSQSKCQCTMSRFIVSDVCVASSKPNLPFFDVFAQCIDCNKSFVVAQHTMPYLGSIELFREHHGMVKEFYEDLES